MPQFEPTWFASQIFWLVIVFYALFRLIKGQVIPKVAAVIGEREARIQGDLELAERRRTELASMMADYEARLAQARSDAQDELRAVQTRMAKMQATALEEVGSELAEQAAATEQRIAREKAAALADLRTVAVEVASAAVGRLSPDKVERSRLEAAVDASMETR